MQYCRLENFHVLNFGTFCFFPLSEAVRIFCDVQVELRAHIRKDKCSVRSYGEEFATWILFRWNPMNTCVHKLLTVEKYSRV